MASHLEVAHFEVLFQMGRAGDSEHLVVPFREVAPSCRVAVAWPLALSREAAHQSVLMGAWVAVMVAWVVEEASLEQPHLLATELFLDA